MRKIIAALAAFAVMALAPATALGAEGGTDRPFKATTNGVFDNRPFGFGYEGTSHGTIVGTHVGKGTFTVSYLAGCGDGGRFCDWFGDGAYTAANGDMLYLSESGVFLPLWPPTTPKPCLGNSSGCEALVSLTITGGTGRFEGASGTLEGVFDAVLIDFDGTTSTYDAHSTIEGTINY